MASKDSNDAIDSYFELERRFEHFLSAVPFKQSHLKVHSPLLAGLLMDAGSLTESIFKSAMDNARYNTIPNIATIRGRRYAPTGRYYNINDSRDVFRRDTLYVKRVWYLPRSDISVPWGNWMYSQQKHPKWWGAYNSVKHDRFNNIEKAKLGTVMHALGATFLVLVQTLDFRVTLVERGIIRCKTMTAQNLRVVSAGWEPLQTSDTIIARTEQFGYKFLSTGSNTQANDVSVFW